MYPILCPLLALPYEDSSTFVRYLSHIPMSGGRVSLFAIVNRLGPPMLNRQPNAMTARTEFHTERLLLRPFQTGDVEDVLAYRDDKEFAQFLPHIPQPFTKRDAEAFVALNMSEPWDQFPTFAVVLNGKVIGTVNLSVDAKTRTAMLGYAVGCAWWGQGIATEAARAVIAWGIETFVVPRVDHTDAMVAQVDRAMIELGRGAAGDLVVIVAGTPPGTPGSTNTVRVHRLGSA